jgi:hypothetical protein
MSALHNKGMKLSTPEYLGGSWQDRPFVIESGFAAYAQCWAGNSGTGRKLTHVGALRL